MEEGQVACPSCGSCPRTGWSEDTAYDGLDLPGAEDEEESGLEAARRSGGWKVVALAVALATLVAFLIWGS